MKEKLLLLSIFFSVVAMAISGEENKRLLINHDLIWTYHNQVTLQNTEDRDKYVASLHSFYRYGFGNTVEKYGKEYTEWKLLGITRREELTSLAAGHDIILKDSTVEEMDSVVAYMREEDSKVYMLINYTGGRFYKYSQKVERNVKYVPEEGEEAVLFDFSIGIGETYNSIYGGNTLTGMNGTTIEETLVNGEPAKMFYVMKDSDRWHFEKYNEKEIPWPYMVSSNLVKAWGFGYVEGIGSINPGGMTGWIDYVTNFLDSQNPAEVLYKVHDNSGNEIFFNDPWNSYAGMTDVRTYQVPGSGIMYDLHGIRVTNPQRGNIYIRDGKKFVYK